MRSLAPDTGLRTVNGAVTSAGAVASGTADWVVTRLSLGVYTVRFLRPFRAPPVVTCTPSGFQTASVGSITVDSVNFSFSTSNTGASADTAFYFQAVGR